MSQDEYAQIDAAVTNAEASLAVVQGAMRGAGPEADQAFNAMVNLARSAGAAGAQFNDAIERLNADDSKPADWRAKQTHLLVEAGSAVVEGARKDVMKAAVQFEAVLLKSIQPAPPADPNQRLLTRNTLDTMLAGTEPKYLASKLSEIVQRGDAAQMAEILGDYGMAKLHNAGEEAKIPTLRDTAIATLVRQKNGLTPAQIGARDGLTAYRELKVLGNVTAHAARAQMQIGRHRSNKGELNFDAAMAARAPRSVAAPLDPPGSLTQSRRSGR